VTNRISMATVVGAASCFLASSALAGIMHPVAGDPVATGSGKVAGTLISAKVKAYLGVPFAAPPIRANRWRAPQPVQSWSGVYTADEVKPECVQGLRSPSINHYFGDEVASEDCLYLNIWEPVGAKPGAKLPVVVWIYGGAFNVGSASSPIYSGEPLAGKGVIYVALNYRLGVFGFLAHPELTAESGHSASGNWGFLDQVAGLKWVQRNIAAFGGDPSNVTLAGQSAGSMSINNLQASPLAKGLFVRVMGLSGATVRGGPGDGAGTTLKVAEGVGLKLQTAMKAASITDMRSVSSDKVAAAAQQAGVRAGPDIDGYYLPDTVQHIFEAGRQADVPVLTGSTANDIGTTPAIRSAKTLAQYTALATQSYGDKAGQFVSLWPATDDAAATMVADQVGRNSGFALGARNWAKMQTLTGKQPAYLFMVNRVQPFTPGVTFSDFDPKTAGAYHMGDVPYFLGTYETFNMFRKTRDWTALDRNLSEQMQNVIVAYAKTGNPNTPNVKFAKYAPGNEQRTDFGDRITVEGLNTKGMDFLIDTPSANEPRQGPPSAGSGGPTARTTF
jgi:para-nitrobenzyl esterase